MRVLMISNDVRILDPQSSTARRMVEYGTLCDKLSIVVLGGGSGEAFALSDSVMVYPTTRSKILGMMVAPLRARTVRHEQSQWDLITVHDPFFAGAVGWVIRLFYGGRLQMQVHTDPMFPHFRTATMLNRLRYWMARFLLPRADCLRVVSGRIEQALRPLVGSTIPISVILTSFVDVAYFENAQPTIDLHKRYASFDFIILMASRLTVEKNFPMALAALEEVVCDFSKTLLLIVGKGPQRHAIEREVAQRNLQDNVRFEGWVDDLSSYYKTADLFLLTSNFEGNSRALIEAVAAGCPCVSTDVGSASEFDGLVTVPVGDDRTLAQVLRQAICDPLSSPPIPSWVVRTKQERLRRYKASWETCVAHNDNNHNDDR